VSSKDRCFTIWHEVTPETLAHRPLNIFQARQAIGLDRLRASFI